MVIDTKFYAYGEELARVEVFKYLGRLIACDNDDTQAVSSNLMKVRLVWARISRVLRAENASAGLCGMFNKATVRVSPHFLGSKHGYCRSPRYSVWKASM